MDNRQRLRRRHETAVVAVLLFAALLAGCNLNDPESPTAPANLTGQNPNEFATFSGVITLSGDGTVPADDQSDGLITVEAVDPSGNPVANGTLINVSTTLGSVRAFGADPATAGGAVQLSMFGGRVSVALRSGTAGDAVVTAWIADVAVSGLLRFEAVAENAFINLVFRGGTGDTPTIETTAPADLTVVARVTDSLGAVLVNQSVKFRIVDDTTGGAAFTSPAQTLTNPSGEAFNVLRIRAVGTVTVVAEYLDPGSGDPVAESNQVIATTTQILQTTVLSLTFSSGSTVTTISTVPTTIGLVATVRDSITNATLSGRDVRFGISSDTATTSPAVLAHTGRSTTNSVGQATNAISGREFGTTVVIFAQLVDESGAVEAESNEVILSIQALAIAVTLEFDGGETVEELTTTPGTIGITAEVQDSTTGALLVGRLVRFRIVSDTATLTPATLAESGASSTDSAGLATNAVTGNESGSTVVVVAELVDAAGTVLATSNQIVLTVP